MWNHNTNEEGRMPPTMMILIFCIVLKILWSIHHICINFSWFVNLLWQGIFCVIDICINTPSETLALLIPPASEPSPCPLLRQSDEKKRERQRRARGRETQRKCKSVRLHGIGSFFTPAVVCPRFFPPGILFLQILCKTLFFIYLSIVSSVRN
jgi:hypothetical protein